MYYSDSSFTSLSHFSQMLLFTYIYSQKGDEKNKREGMVVLKEICKKDRGYKAVIEESPLVKNAVSLLGGRRRKEGGRDIWEKEGEGEGEGGERDE